VPTARIADALSVTLLIESTLNAGAMAACPKSAWGRVKSVATGDARCRWLSGPVLNDRSPLRGRGNFLRYHGENPFFQAKDWSGSASGDRFGTTLIFETKRPLKVETASATRATRRASGEGSNALPYIEEQQEW
jgi:hypothetical protein